MRTITTLSIALLFSATAFAEKPAMNHAQTDHSQMNHSQMVETTTPAKAEIYSSIGVIKRWSETSVSIAHQPISALNWPAMTMGFSLSGYQGEKFSVGQKVNFTFRQSDSGYQLISAKAQ